MMTEQTLKAKFEIKELELNALLEITQAINNNLPEESLYKIFNFTLRSNLNIQKLALFVLGALEQKNILVKQTCCLPLKRSRISPI
jgi:hypothetical protein